MATKRLNGFPSFLPSTLALLLEAAALSMQTTNTPWRFSGAGVDSSVFRYVALVMHRGGMPYLDTFDHKGPLVYIINYLGMRISFWRGLWLFEFLAILVLCFFLYRIARVFLDWIPSHFVVLSTASLLPLYLQGGNLVEEWALPFIAFATWVFFDFFRTRSISYTRIAGCGLSLASVLMLRPNMISTWIICVPYALYYLIIYERRELCKCSVAFVTGLLIVLVPILFWLASNAALDAFIDDYLVFNFSYSAGHGASLFQNTLDRIGVALHFLNNPIILFSFFVPLVSKSSRTSYRIICIINILLGIATISMSGYQFNHYGMVLLPAVAACISIGLSDMHSIPDTKRGLLCWQPVVTTVFVCLLLQTVIPSWLTCLDNAVAQYTPNGESHVFDGETGEAIKAVQDYTQPEDQITVCGNTDLIYLASGRMSSSYYSYQTPIASFDSEILPAYLNDLRKNNPSAIVMPNNYEFREELMMFISENDYRKIGDTSKHWATIWVKE